MNKFFIFMLYFLALILLIVIGGYLFLHSKPFGKNPDPQEISSPNFFNGEFKNQSPTRLLKDAKERWSVLKKTFTDKHPDNRPLKPIASVKTNIKELPTDEDQLIWFGHSSLYLQVNALKILIDPVLYSASPIKFFNKSFQSTHLYKAEDFPEIDYIVLTHDHWDHLDYHTIRRLHKTTKHFICPIGVGSHLKHWGVSSSKITEVDWYDKINAENGLKITALPARHFSGRGLKSNPTLWASYMLESSYGNIYLSGDTGYDKHFKEIKSMFPEISIAVLENGQYNEDWEDIHMMPDDLVQTIDDLHPDMVLTIHHSKYALARHAWYEPLELISAIASKKHINLLAPKIGEKVTLNGQVPILETWWKNTAE